MIEHLGKLHAGLIFERRTRVLAEEIARLIPRNASVLDVGCGDGTISSLIEAQRSDVSIEGIDVMVRQNTKIPVTAFDGDTIPFAAGSKDVVMFVDVLHHTDHPERLIEQAARIATKAVIIKDHVADNRLDRLILSIMDWVGNAPHGVVLPYNYLSGGAWKSIFAANHLDLAQSNDRVALYPWPLSAVFGRNLHFVRLLIPRIEYQDAA